MFIPYVHMQHSAWDIPWNMGNGSFMGQMY